MKKKGLLIILPLAMSTGLLSLSSVSFCHGAAESLSGLYETSYAPEEETLTDGLLEDFESTDSFGYKTSFAFFYQNGLSYSASINHEAGYLSSNAGSLKLDYQMAAYLDPAIYPSLYFAIPTSAQDFDGQTYLSFDYWNLSSADLSYSLWALGDFVGGGYTYKYSEGNANPKGDVLFLTHGSTKQSVKLTLNVDFGKYNDGETTGGAPIPRKVTYLRILLPTTGSGNAQLYLDNVRIGKIN